MQANDKNESKAGNI